MHCMICLEAGGTERPPCGFWHEGIGFHAACLERLADSGSTQCPHCGVCVPTTALKRMNRVLKGWLKTEDKRRWNHGPLFIRVQSGMMYGAEEAKVLCAAIGVVVSCLMLVAKQRSRQTEENQEEGVVFISRHEANNNTLLLSSEHKACYYRFWLYQGMHIIQVVLKRVAMLSSSSSGNHHQRIECDGYEISASRKKRKLIIGRS